MNRLKAKIADEAYKAIASYKNSKINIAELKERLNVKKWVPEDFQYFPEENAALNEKKHIVVGLLHCEETSYNMIYSLYHAFEEDDLCSPIVILQGKGYKNQYRELEKQMIECGMRYEFDYNSTEKIFDILIVHHVQLPPTEDIKKIIDNSALRVAVPVGVVNYGTKSVNLEHLKTYRVSEVFLERSLYKNRPQDISEEVHFHVTGNPKFDCIYDAALKKIQIPPQFEKLSSKEIKKIILWTTDHKPNFLLCTPDVAFDLYANTVFNYVKTHKDVGLIFRPYRAYIDELLRDGLWTEEQVGFLKSYCDNSDNIVWDDEPDYSASYSLADAIIADAGCGIICSSLPLMKPIGITVRWDMATDKIISHNQEIIGGQYLISSEKEMLSFIEMIKEDKNFDIEKRKELCKKYVTYFDGKIGKRIKDIIIQEWRKK